VNYYENELKALKRSGRLRSRDIVNSDLHDFASNDYLGLAHNKEILQSVTDELIQLPAHSSKASLLVNGYHQVHKSFENYLCEVNGFEDGVVLGSGFVANIAMIEALVRKGDILFMDELYHASGVLATKLEHVNVVFFQHNDMDDLQACFKKYKNFQRKIVAVEGIYSMDGDLVSKDVFRICDDENALLIVDEAHSSGVIGENLMGVFDFYNIKIEPNHIKMGTLGKAYGSFGAYILASKHIVEYLINRAKPIIYATSLSLFDTLLAHRALEYIIKNKESLKAQILQKQKIIYEYFGIHIDGLIVPILIGDNAKVLEIKAALQNEGYAVGAIRQPTVPSAIVRLIARVGESDENLMAVSQKIQAFVLK